MQLNNNYASKGLAGTSLGFGIGATALTLLQNGVAGNLLGGNKDVYTTGMAERDAKIAELTTEVKLRDSYLYTDQKVDGKVDKVRDELEGRIRCLEGKMCEQYAYNAANNATIGCIQNQIQQLYGMTKIVIPQSSICATTTTTTTAAAS